MTFPIHFLLCNIVLTGFLGLVLLFRTVFRRHVTADSRRRIWYIWMLALVLPLVPEQLFDPAGLIYKIRDLLPSASSVSGIPAETNDTAITSMQLGLSDFASSLDGSTALPLSTFLAAFWGIGCAVTFLCFIIQIYKIYMLKNSARRITPEQEPDLYALYSSCMRKAGVRRQVDLYTSCRIESPASCGILRPTIFIPEDLDILLSADDIRFIFLHELQHLKHKDAILNGLSCILQILYWFHPLIRYSFTIMRRDCEIACDHAVIRTAGREQAASYGHMLIRYAGSLRDHAFLSPLSSLGGDKSAALRRIKEIAEYRPDTRSRKCRSIVILLLTALLLLAASPFLSVYAFPDSTFDLSDLSAKQLEQIDLSACFAETQGSFVLYDVTKDQWQIYNEKLSTRRVSPDSTFKIYSGLFALEEGLIAPESSGREWNGTAYPFESWNQDQTLATAMQNSVNWYFQDLDQQMGISALYSYYRQVSYGNCDLSSGTDHYWAEASLKISPAEQVLLLSGLLQNRWGFDEENIQAVKNALFIADTPLGKLYGKTGTGLENGKNVNGWFVGFLENEGHVRCFATNIRDTDGADGTAAAEITLEVLNSL